MALTALGVALLAQLVYLAVRFRWTFAAAAVLAMRQDVLVVLGVFAWRSSLTDFALALLGLVVGTYSSAFTAAPLVLLLEGRSSTPPPLPKRAAPAPRAGRLRESGAVV